MDPWHGVLWRMWWGPRMRCLQRGDMREEVQRRVWRGPRELCHRGGDSEAACERSGFGGFTLSDGVWWGSGTTATGPAWRWPPRCGAVCFSRLLIDAGSCFDGDFLSRSGLVAATTWLAWPLWPCSFEFLPVMMPQFDRVRVEM